MIVKTCITQSTKVDGQEVTTFENIFETINILNFYQEFYHLSTNK